jgi:hypothetical protein
MRFQMRSPNAGALEQALRARRDVRQIMRARIGSARRNAGESPLCSEVGTRAE